MRVLAAFLAMALLSGCLSASAPPADPGASVVAEADAKGPAWSFVDVDGAQWSRDAPAGNASVLFFMATWCPVCKREAPMLAEIHGERAGEGVRFFTLDFDATEDPDALREWSDRYAQPWPHGIDEGLRVQRALGVKAESSIVVLDADGRIIEMWEHGMATREGVLEALDQAVA